MPLKKISLKTTEIHRGKRLDQVLTELLPESLKSPISKGKIRKLIIAGAVYLNGKRVRIASRELLPGARIDLYVDLDRIHSDGKSKDVPFELTQDRVLFEDEYLIAINKPPGLPTQPTLDEARVNLFSSLKSFLARRDRIAVPSVYIGLHHRLDRDTSGVILFTKKKEANAGISEAFSSHRAQKTYQALAAWNPTTETPSAWTIRNYLGRKPSAGKKVKITSVRSGGDFAETEFKILERLQGALSVEAKPKTGRTHQIRVHLSENHMPILGDEWYGAPSEHRGLKIPRVMLHASSLTFSHPIYQTEVVIRCPLPEDFEKCLKALRRGTPDF